MTPELAVTLLVAIPFVLLLALIEHVSRRDRRRWRASTRRRRGFLGGPGP